MDLLDIAKRVRRGVRLLDKKIPNWRVVMRKHQEQFDLTSGEHCVLGTLEHHSGRMRVLEAKKGIQRYTYGAFARARIALGLVAHGSDYGFDWRSTSDGEEGKDALTALWRAEFEK